MIENLFNENLAANLFLDDDQFYALMWHLQRDGFKGSSINLLANFQTFREYPSHFAYTEELLNA